MLRLNKPAIIAGAIAALALVPATSGATPSADELNPPPPSDYTCKPVGGGTICTVIRHESKVAELQPELSCGSGADAFNIYDNGDVEQRLTRRYNADADLTQRVNHSVWLNAFWSNPLTGKTVTYTQRGTTMDDFVVPGQLDAVVETVTGENVYTDPVTHQKVLMSVGRTVFGPDGLEFSAGQHWDIDLFVNGDSSVLDPVCAALS